MKSAIAPSASSKSSPERTSWSPGSASITASQVPAPSSSAKIGSASEHMSAARFGSNCVAGARTCDLDGSSDAADAVRYLAELRQLCEPRAAAERRLLPGRRASRGRSTARRRPRATRARPRTGSAARRARRAMRACSLTMPSRSRCPASMNSSATRNRCNGGLPDPTSRNAAAAPRALPNSWSYFPDFSAMSSPNHFACSWASE